MNGSVGWFVHGMPAGDRNVNAQYARREIDQIISLNRGRVRFQPPVQTPANVDHSRRTWYFFNPTAIELLRRPNLPFSLLHSHTESDAAILQTFGEYVSTRRRGKSIDHWGGSLEGSLLFIGTALKKNCSRGKVSWNLGSEWRWTFFSLRLSMHRLSAELLGEQSNPLNKD